MKSFLNYFTFIIIFVLNIKEIKNKNHIYYKMEKGIEQNFTNINTSNIYHYSINVEREDNVEILIKLDLKYNANDFILKYYGDTSTKPTSKIEDEGEIIVKEKIKDSFLNLKGSYLVSKPFIYYVSFTFEPKKDIDIIYIKITKKSTLSPLSRSLLLTVIISSIIITLISIYTISKICKKCKDNKKKNFLIPQNIKEDIADDVIRNDIKADISGNIIDI